MIRLANIIEYDIKSKLIFLRIIILKFIMIRKLFHVKNVCKNVKNQHVLNGLTANLYTTVSRIIILSLKSIGQI